MNSQQESEQSRKVRRGFGYLAIGALCVAAVGFIIGLAPVGVTGFLVFLLLPYTVMVVHLNATRALTLTEEKLWARELWLSHRSIVAVWAYLFAADLGERAGDSRDHDAAAGERWPLGRPGQGSPRDTFASVAPMSPGAGDVAAFRAVCLEVIRGITIQPVTRDSWEAFARLFEAKGSPHYCWCTPYRVCGGRKSSDTQKRASMLKLVDAGTPIGLLACKGTEPVGWCSVAPRETYARLDRSRTMPRVTSSETPTWTGCASSSLSAIATSVSRAPC